MSSEGGVSASYKKPFSAIGSLSDDEISVIAVIKKGTSGIPKRARYHYIRELPLASVKSFKKSLQKAKEVRRGQGRENEGFPKTSQTKEPARVLNEPKKPRVIELSDEISKMELRRQFKINEESVEDEEEADSSRRGLSTASGGREADIIHKLPPGTVLIKQEPRTPRLGPQNDDNTVIEANEPGSNNNCSSVATTTTTSSSNNSNASSSASSVSSCGSGSSSGGFGSGSGSPSAKVKRTHRTSKGGGRKTKIVDVVPRRNPKRSGSKKGATTAEVAIPSTTGTATRPRQRQRLLTTRRQERNGGMVEAGTNRRTKPGTMPYMNTRSVTRKLYTVGATYQAPTLKDETEWREWPAHGMHERPVFHPQIGLAAGYAGRVFWSTPDAEGSNWTYREVLDAPEEVEIVPVDPGPSQTPSTLSPIKTGSKSAKESFEVCMHDSLHSVLAYCAQIMAPGYRKMVEKERRHDVDGEKYPPQDSATEKEEVREKAETLKPLDAESTHMNFSQLEDSAISDETLMEMSSIYKKLLPIEDQPSSREESPSALAQTSPYAESSYKRKKTAETLSGSSSGLKDPNEASEIAKILSEYNEGLKESLGRPFRAKTHGAASPRSVVVSNDYEEGREAPEAQRESLATGKTLEDEKGCKTISPTDAAKMAKEREVNGYRWLEDLLVDTSLLYCVATGVGQRNLTEYVDGLDAKQSLQWLRRRDG